MTIIISFCSALWLALPLAAQGTARSGVGSTTSIVQGAGAITSFGKAAPIHRQMPDSIGMQTWRSLDSASRSKSSARPYVIGGAILGVVAAGAGLGVYFRQSHAELMAPPIVFAPLFVASAAVGAGIGYILYRARH